MASFITDWLKKVGGGIPISGLTLDKNDLINGGIKQGTLNGKRVSVFVGVPEETIKRLKVLRHPNILSFVDSYSDKKGANWLVTQPVIPYSNDAIGEWTTLMAYQLAEALLFLEKAGIGNGAIGLDSFYQSADGGGLRIGGVWHNEASVDLDRKEGLQLVKEWTGMACSSFQQVITKLKGERLVQLYLSLDQISVASDGDRLTTIHSAIDYLSSIAERDGNYLIARRFLAAILCLFTAIGQQPTNSILSSMPLSKLAIESLHILSHSFFDELSLSVLSRIISITDRGIRLFLLDSLPRIHEAIPAPFLGEPLYPTLQSGFQDANQTVRDATLRAMVLLAPGLPKRILNEDLLRHFARLQEDPQPGIRVNVLIGLGRISEHLSLEVRKRTMGPAYCRGLRDAFPPARLAAIAGLKGAVGYLGEGEVAREILPVLVTLLIDSEIQVKTAARELVQILIDRLHVPPTKSPEITLKMDVAREQKREEAISAVQYKKEVIVDVGEESKLLFEAPIAKPPGPLRLGKGMTKLNN